MHLRCIELHPVASWLRCCAILTSVRPQQHHPSLKQYLGGWGVLSKWVRLQFFTVTTRRVMPGIWSLFTWLLTTVLLCCSTCGVYRGITENLIQPCDGFPLSWQELCFKELHQSPTEEAAYQLAFKNILVLMLFQCSYIFLFIKIFAWQNHISYSWVFLK